MTGFLPSAQRCFIPSNAQVEAQGLYSLLHWASCSGENPLGNYAGAFLPVGKEKWKLSLTEIIPLNRHTGWLPGFLHRLKYTVYVHIPLLK